MKTLSNLPKGIERLTTGVDDINGTATNDTINALTVNSVTGADASTFTAFDDIDGGAGKDTLNIYTAFDGADVEADGDTADQNAAFPASASVKNVEIVNVLNSELAVEAFANAAKFTGVEQLWQVNAAAGVTNLKATTTAGFRDIAAGTLSVAAAATAASATVALDNVDDASSLSVEGEALNSVTVAGAVVDAGEDGVDAIALDVTVGEDEQTLTVNTAVDATLTYDDEGSAADAKVTAINASASAGGIAFTGDADVASLQTGAGDDEVTLNTAFSADVTSASVETGAGDDEITLAATGAGDITADAGAGDDVVNVAAVDALSTDSSVDGGEGTDTLAIGNETAVELVAEDYTLLNNVFSNFEELSFAGNATFDASRLSDYKSFTLEAGGTVTKVADDQAITTGADLDVTAAGYDASGSTTVYAGNLNVTANGTTTVTAQGESIDLTAAATKAAAADVTLEGDVKEAVVNVNNFADEATETFNGATVNVVTRATAVEAVEADTAADPPVAAVEAQPVALASMTTLTLTGNGSANVTNGVDTALVTVDASALNSVDAEGEAATGLTYNSSNAAAETVTLGDGLDAITLNASSVLNTDTIVGFNLVANAAGNLDRGASDDLDFAGLGTNVTAIGEITAASLDLALIKAIDDDSNEANGIIFDFDGDTYVYQSADTVVNDGDALVKLTGGVDQDLLDAMFVDI